MKRLLTAAVVLILTAPTFAEQPSDVLDIRPYAYRVEYTPELRPAMRGILSDRFEIESNSHRISYRGKSAAGGTAWYRLNDRFALGLTANLDEDVKGYGIGARIYFGK